MASTSRIGVVLTFLLLATWLAAPVSSWLTTPAAAQKKAKEDEKKKGAKTDPKAAETSAKDKAKAAKDAAKMGKAGAKIPAASINKTCCYTEKSKCEGSCGFADGARTAGCRQECEGNLRNCLGMGVFITRRGSQVVCAKR